MSTVKLSVTFDRLTVKLLPPPSVSIFNDFSSDEEDSLVDELSGVDELLDDEL